MNGYRFESSPTVVLGLGLVPGRTVAAEPADKSEWSPGGSAGLLVLRLEVNRTKYLTRGDA